MTNENTVNIFEVATRNMYRFPFKGTSNVEDMWQISVKELDSVFKVLNSELKQVKEESLLEIKTQQDQELDIKIAIIKHIVKVKQEEAEKQLQAKSIKEQKQKLMEIYASKKDEETLKKSPEEIKAMIDALDI